MPAKKKTKSIWQRFIHLIEIVEIVLEIVKKALELREKLTEEEEDE